MTRREPLFNQANRKEIARRFKSFRNKHLMTQEELAKALEISRNTVSHYERQGCEPQLHTLRKFVELERKLIGEGWVRPWEK